MIFIRCNGNGKVTGIYNLLLVAVESGRKWIDSHTHTHKHHSLCHANFRDGKKIAWRRCFLLHRKATAVPIHMYNLYNLLGVIGSLIRHMCQSDFVTSSSLKGTPRYILFSLLHCVCMSRRVLSQCMLLLHFFFCLSYSFIYRAKYTFSEIGIFFCCSATVFFRSSLCHLDEWRTAILLLMVVTFARTEYIHSTVFLYNMMCCCCCVVVARRVRLYATNIEEVTERNATVMGGRASEKWEWKYMLLSTRQKSIMWRWWW